MKRYNPFSKSRLVTGIYLGLAGFFSHPSFAADIPDETKAGKPACCVQELGSTPILSDSSLYQVDSTWTTDSGKKIHLSSLSGRPQVITMFFANCEYACPILANDMRKLEAALPVNIRTNVGFILVTFDSDRDTPEALAKYRVARSIPDHWTLLTANPDDILELSQLLGVKFKKDARGQFSHSNIITILNEKGEIVHQKSGLNSEPSEGVQALVRLMKGEK